MAPQCDLSDPIHFEFCTIFLNHKLQNPLQIKILTPPEICMRNFFFAGTVNLLTHKIMVLLQGHSWDIVFDARDISLRACFFNLQQHVFFHFIFRGSVKVYTRLKYKLEARINYIRYAASKCTLRTRFGIWSPKGGSCQPKCRRHEGWQPPEGLQMPMRVRKVL